MVTTNKFWNFIKNSESTGDLQLYGEIANETWWGDEVTPRDFKNDLDNMGDISTLNVYINSPGGDVFAGQAIHSMLKRHKAKVNVYVDGLAASIASVIAMAGDKVIMPKNSMMMVHNPWSIVAGNSADFRKMADDLDKIGKSIKEAYLSKATELDVEMLKELMDDETWLTAQDCLDYGFADEIEETKAVAACVDSKYLKAYKNIPQELIKVEEPEKPKNEPENESENEPENKDKLLLEIDLI